MEYAFISMIWPAQKFRKLFAPGSSTIASTSSPSRGSLCLLAGSYRLANDPEIMQYSEG